jgi:predicted helicase
MERFCDDYNAEIDRYLRKGKDANLDEFLNYAKVKWSRNLKRSLRNAEYLTFDGSCYRLALYRAFTKRYVYLADIAIDELGQIPKFLPSLGTSAKNTIICCTNHTQIPFSVQMTDCIPDAAIAGRAGQSFPFYIYDEDGTNRRDNITDWALQQFRTHYGDDTISKWDIFYYVYGLLHHPGYRTKFADNLKRELPRIPFAPDFPAFAAAGKELAALHLDYEKLEPYPLKWLETEGVPLSYKVEDKMRLTKDKTALRVNPSLTLATIPPETFQYRLGNRSALEWVIDQYQVSEDKRSGIRSDPNRPDDEEYIVRLVGEVVRVSLETVRLVASLPDGYAE